jgi:hypothetical protein
MVNGQSPARRRAATRRSGLPPTPSGGGGEIQPRAQLGNFLNFLTHYPVNFLLLISFFLYHAITSCLLCTSSTLSLFINFITLYQLHQPYQRYQPSTLSN